MGYYGIRQDELATQRLLSSIGESGEVHLASGYFNLPPQYIDAIFRGKGRCHVLAASPQVSSDLDQKLTNFAHNVHSNGCIISFFFVVVVVLRQMVSMEGRAWQVMSQ